MSPTNIIIIKSKLYTDTIKKIQQINCEEIIEPHKVLIRVLAWFISDNCFRHKKHDPYFFSKSNSRKNLSDREEAKKVTCLLADSQSDDPVFDLVQGLNFYYSKKQINIKNNLWKLLCAFFSIYTPYHGLMTDYLYKAIFIQDEWRKKVLIFELDLKAGQIPDEPLCSLLEQYPQLADLIPHTRMVNLWSSLIASIEKAFDAWQPLRLVRKLSQLVPTEKSEKLLNVIMERMQKARPELHPNFRHACDALISLKDKFTQQNKLVFSDYLYAQTEKLIETKKFIEKDITNVNTMFYYNNKLRVPVDIIRIFHNSFDQLINFGNKQLNAVYFDYLQKQLFNTKLSYYPFEQQVQLFRSLTLFKDQLNDEICHRVLELICGQVLFLL